MIKGIRNGKYIYDTVYYGNELKTLKDIIENTEDINRKLVYDKDISLNTLGITIFYSYVTKFIPIYYKDYFLEEI